VHRAAAALHQRTLVLSTGAQRSGAMGICSAPAVRFTTRLLEAMTMRHPLARPVLHCGLVCAAVISLCAATEIAADSYRDTPFQSDAEPDAPRSAKPGRKWQEGDFSLPAWPADGDLIALKLDGPEQPFTYFIDERSLQTGADGVVRYTLVTKTASGARNISFEGLRCTPNGRWKTYAYGTDGRFEPAGMAGDWRRIGQAGDDPLHFDLWRHYLCIPRAFKPRPTSQQVRALKSGRVPQVENAGFITD
jgi:hypothetical protein